MLQTILVPLDGSPVAEEGMVSACRLASETGATLSLVRGVPYFALEPKSQSADRAAVRDAREYLYATQEELMAQAFKVRIEVLPSDPVGAILFAADMQEVDLISICTHGRSGLQHALLGSVAEAVLRRSDKPMLVTRAGSEMAGESTVPFRRILAPLDGTTFAEAAVTYLTSSGIGGKGELILMRAVAPVVPRYVPGLIGSAAADLYSQADRETQQHLRDADAYLRATGNEAWSSGKWHAQAVFGSAAQSILEVARTEKVDLIVLVTHGRHGIERLLYGSVARELLHHATVPLLILPAVGDPESAP